MKRTNLFLGLAFALFCSLPMYAQTVSEDVDINTTSESVTPRFVNMFINDNGAIYPIYVPNLSENTKIQEAGYQIPFTNTVKHIFSQISFQAFCQP